MKRIKWIPAFFIVFLLLLSVTCGAASARRFFYDGAFHEYTGNIYKLKVNDVYLTPPVPPIIFSGYSVVPARAVFQDGLGAEVSWDGLNQKVTIKMDKMKLILTINDTTAFLNGKEVTMPIAPKIINDYTVIPARFVGENLNMDVSFDEKTGTISLKNKPVETKPVETQPEDIVLVTDVSYTKKSSKEGVITVTTDSDNPEFNAFILSEPTRLVVDVLDGQYKKTPSVIDVGQGNLDQIRFGQQESGARIVVDLTKNLGYTVKTSLNKVIISVKIDPNAESGSEDETPVTKPATKPEDTEPDDEDEEETPGIFDYVIYGYEGGRDYIRFGTSVGKAVKSGKTITVPVYGDFPDEECEKKVVGFFGTKMTYSPGKDGGTLTITLKNDEVEMYTQGKEIRLNSVHKALPRSVMLDAGHGGQDAGAVAENEDGTIKAMEKDFNLDIALRTRDLLEAQGVDVHMIRTEDVYVDFLRVGGIANDAGTTLFVSIHTNSALSSQAHGIETFGYLEAGSVSNGMTSERLSEIMLEEMIDKTGAYERGVKDGKSLAVINSTKMPATLVEIGFISNEEECDKMMTEEYRQRLAQAICDGVLRAFEEMEI